VYIYTNHRSASVKDFLLKLYEIMVLNLQDILNSAIKSLGLTHWYSRVRVSKDNAICEGCNRIVSN
jgi:transposase InsO family protein